MALCGKLCNTIMYTIRPDCVLLCSLFGTLYYVPRYLPLMGCGIRPQALAKEYGSQFRLDYALSREQKNRKGGKMYIQVRRLGPAVSLRTRCCTSVLAHTSPMCHGLSEYTLRPSKLHLLCLVRPAHRSFSFGLL